MTYTGEQYSMITGSKELIRDINKHLVLETIIHQGPLSRADLAKAVKLTKATISAIVQELLADQLVIEIGSAKTDKGRKPILLKFHSQGGHAISIDLGPTMITVLTSNLAGEQCQVKQYSNIPVDTSILTPLRSIITETIQSLPDTPHGVVGISIGIHGVVHEQRVIFSPHYHLEEVDFVHDLRETFHIPVYVENEANLSVQGEHAFCYDYPNMVNLSIHSGVGMGLLIDHNLYTGFQGFAGEFGHTIVVPDGRLCPCGNRGCIEQYASETALLKEYAKRKKQKSISFDAFVRDYQNKDPYAKEILDEFIKYMSIGINNILNTMNPNLIIINSSFTIYIPGITEMLKDALKNRMSKYCTIVPSRLQDSAILLGGVYVCIKGYLGVTELKLSKSDGRIPAISSCTF